MPPSNPPSKSLTQPTSASTSSVPAHPHPHSQNQISDEDSVRLGNALLYGLNDTEVNVHEAYKYFHSAASNSSNIGALIQASYCLIHNIGQPPLPRNTTFPATSPTNIEQAKRFLSIAVKRGSTKASCLLGKLYLRENNLWEAEKLLNSAARLGHVEALTLAGKLNLMFNNYEDAISKFSIAARKNCGNAHNELGVLHYHGLAPGLLPKISNNIDSNSNNNNDDNNSMTNAFSYFQRAAELHNCAGINNLGMMYELGQGTTSRDLAHAVRCYELAAEEGYLPAIANLGRLLLQTASIDLKFADGAHGGEEKVEQFEAIQQVDRAIFNLRRASDLGDARSSLELGIVFASGVHSWSETTVPRDAVAALSHFKRACAISRGEHQGHNTDEANKNKTTMKESSSKTAHKNDTLKVAAKLAAGLLYDEGRMSEAYSYYETSASIGDVESYNCLGIMCEEGKGVPVDVQQACTFFLQGRSSKSRPHSGFCCFNLAQLLSNYISDGEVLLKIKHSAEYFDSNSWSLELSKMAALCTMIRHFVGSQLSGKTIQKGDLRVLISLYKEAREMGCEKGWEEEKRLEAEQRKEDAMKRALDSARGIDVFAGQNDVIRREVVCIGSGVLAKSGAEEEEAVEEEAEEDNYNKQIDVTESSSSSSDGSDASFTRRFLSDNAVLSTVESVLTEEDDWDDIKIGADQRTGSSSGSVSATPPTSRHKSHSHGSSPRHQNHKKHSITSQSDASNNNSNSSGSGSGSGTGSYESSAEWYYLDKTGEVQGPFQSDMINQWVQSEMLPKDLTVREGSEGPFQPLDDLWDAEFGVDKSIARSFYESPIGKNASMHKTDM